MESIINHWRENKQTQGKEKKKIGNMKIIKVLFPEKLCMSEFEEVGTYAFF